MKLSPWAQMVYDYVPKNAFIKISSSLQPTEDDIKNFINLYIFENIPNFILDQPIGFDRIRQMIASSIGVKKNEIYLTGSAKLGFSLNPDNWLEPFKPEKSDLDFFIISSNMLERLNNDVKLWTHDIRNKIEQDAFEYSTRIYGKGFLDTWHIPTRYPVSNKCNHAMHLACLRINEVAKRTVINEKNRKNASIRCYASVEAAISQISFNIQHAIKFVLINR